MSNPIITWNDNATPDQVSTRKASTEDAESWVIRHFTNVQSEWEGDAFPLSDLLCTEWTYATETGTDTETECTPRLPNETDADFLGRHAEEVTSKMVEVPPIP